MGIYDQLMVLKWVQKNIEKFGGDAGKVELVSKELNHLAATLHVHAGVWVKKNIIIFQKEKENSFTLLILKKEKNSTNLLLWPPICWNKSAITPKWFNSLDTNSKESPAFKADLDKN